MNIKNEYMIGGLMDDSDKVTFSIAILGLMCGFLILRGCYEGDEYRDIIEAQSRTIIEIENSTNDRP